jgi:uncharacterized SAM-binding protein YcdF (DUF218 family)
MPAIRTAVRRARKLLLWAFVAFVCWLVLIGGWIVHYGSTDHKKNSDCIIVLGAAIQGDKPSPVFEERLRHAVNLYRNGYAPKLILTGGLGDGRKRSESSVASDFVRRFGVPNRDIIIEERSRTTYQNLQESADVMKAKGFRTAIVVSDPLHMERSMMMAGDLGLDAVSSPTPTSRYRTLGPQLGFLYREIYFFHYYLITNE